MPVALSVESVSKCFKIERNRPLTLKESMIRYLTGNHSTHGILWALRDVSFSVEQGRALGIIGHNGAGKSTLLRLLCGLGRPSAGRIHRRGYVSGLLELGSGFNLEMTGMENIMTAGILNGLTKRQMLSCKDEIISFAELEEFVDQPLRTYSTGMYLRLAFSTAIHFDPDVLMIDEVMAVGDLRFQQKCMDRLRAFRKARKTLVLVSHSTDQIRSLCDEVVVLEEGRVVMLGDPESAINCYHDVMRERTERRAAQLGTPSPPGLSVEHGSRMGTQEASISAVHLFDGHARPTDFIYSGAALTIELEYVLSKPIPDLSLSLGIYSEANIKCFETTVPSIQAFFGRLTEKGTLRCILPELPVLPGHYFIAVGLCPPDWSYVYDYHWQMHPLHILKGNPTPSDISGVVLVRPAWSIEPGNSNPKNREPGPE